MVLKELFYKLIPGGMRGDMTGDIAADASIFGASVLFTFLFLVALVFAAIILRMINKKVFSLIKKKRGKKTHILFLEKVINAAIIVVVIIIPLAGDSIGKSILGSAAVLTAVVGFAAQDVIKDMLSGFLISVYKPFDIGDRIELEDGTVGVVESITMRHVVVIRIDTLRVIIPNSRINSLSVTNYSFDYVDRSNLFKFPVGYDSDIEKVKEVIAGAVESSPYSFAGKKLKDGSLSYGPVYFLELADSALIMAVTVYYKPSDPTEIVKDDINTRVFKALDEAGIEIPYPYSNVVLKKTD